jgi:hypothetical protein
MREPAMRYFRESKLVRSILLPLAFAVSLSACTSRYVPMQAPYEESIARETPGDVIVTLDDRRRLRVVNPRTDGDSLRGVVYAVRTRAYTDSVSLAYSEVVKVEKGKTYSPWLWVAGGALFVGMITFAINNEGAFQRGN